MTITRRWKPWTVIALLIAVACGSDEEGGQEEEGGRGGEGGVAEDGGQGGQGGTQEDGGEGGDGVGEGGDGGVAEGGDGGTGGDEPGDELIGSDVTVVIATPSEGTAITGIVTVPYLRAESRALLVNVAIDWDGDGAIAAYDVDDGMQEEWVVRNVPIVPAETTYSHSFAVVDPALEGGVPVHVVVTAGDEAASDAPVPGTSEEIPAGGFVFEDDVTSEAVTTESLATAPDGYVGQGSGDLFDTWRNEQVGNIEVPGGMYRPGLPNAPQAPNACVLASIANNLSWLGRLHGLAECLTGTAVTGSMYGVDSTEALQELAAELNEVGGFDYDPVLGVQPDHILEAKQQFVAMSGLPIESTRVDTNVYATIQEKMRDGCAVEVVISSPGVAGYHMVSASGFFDADLGSSRYRTLVVHDTAFQGFNDVYEVNLADDGSAKIRGYPYDAGPADADINFAIVQCVTEIQAVTLDYAHGPLPAGTVVDIACITGGHVAMPDACSCDHYHGDPITIDVPSMSISTVPVADMSPMACGHGCVAEFMPEDVDVICCRPPM